MANEEAELHDAMNNLRSRDWKTAMVRGNVTWNAEPPPMVKVECDFIRHDWQASEFLLGQKVFVPLGGGFSSNLGNTHFVQAAPVQVCAKCGMLRVEPKEKPNLTADEMRGLSPEALFERYGRHKPNLDPVTKEDVEAFLKSDDGMPDPDVKI